MRFVVLMLWRSVRLDESQSLENKTRSVVVSVPGLCGVQTTLSGPLNERARTQKNTHTHTHEGTIQDCRHKRGAPFAGLPAAVQSTPVILCGLPPTTRFPFDPRALVCLCVYRRVRACMHTEHIHMRGESVCSFRGWVECAWSVQSGRVTERHTQMSMNKRCTVVAIS